MKILRLIAILLAALIITSLVGCKRSIPGSTAGPESTAEGDVSEPIGGPTDVLEQIYLFATQTAVATQGLTTPVPSSLETSNPAAPGAATTAEAPSSTDQGAVQPPIAATPLPNLTFNPTPGIPSSYSLHTGEFPYCIARRFNVNPGALLNTNGLTSYSVYYNGMVLTIPQNTGGFPGSRALRPHPATYTVRSDDTIYTIACAYGDVDPNAIIFVNGLDEDGSITAGQVLQIP